jgi:hypothetical protein
MKGNFLAAINWNNGMGKPIKTRFWQAGIPL